MTDVKNDVAMRECLVPGNPYKEASLKCEAFHTKDWWQDYTATSKLNSVALVRE